MKLDNPLSIGDCRLGVGEPLGVIAGPCVMESLELTLQIARQVHAICRDLELPWIFKASFDKANRTRGDSYRGMGLEQGVAWLRAVRDELGVPVTTDIHESWQAQPVAEVCELLQVPAFLARQTDLLIAAAQTGRAVNVKKGQFMAPWDMQHVATKLADHGCSRVLLTERGTFFGYGRLVNDMRSIPEMKRMGAVVVFDATHSVQEPSAREGVTGGQRQDVPVGAAAGVAAGADVVFLETHPDPDRSPSDGPNMVPLAQLRGLLSKLKRVFDAAREIHE